MEKTSIREEIEAPEKVSVSIDNNKLKVKGEKGEIIRLFDSKLVKVSVEGSKVVVESKGVTKRDKRAVGTFASLIGNMMKGAKEGHTYRLKICSGHFPINVSVSGSQFIVKNFFGEKIPRVLNIKPGAKVEVKAPDVIVTGTDMAVVSQVAADIEQLTRRVGFDRRIFQDGIWITEKDGETVGE